MQGKEHKPTKTTRALVAARKAQGKTDEQIAAYFDITFETLTKHYRIELRTARAIFTDKVFGKLSEKINEGSEKSIHFYLTHIDKWTSGDKEKEIDALKEQAAAALERQKTLDERTQELRDAKEPKPSLPH